MKALPLMDSFYGLTPESEIVVQPLLGAYETKKIQSLKKINKYVLVSFFGVNDPETALKYRGAIISTDKNLLSDLQETEYFHDQIIGLTVYTSDGDIIGTVSEIFETGSNDIFVVNGSEKEYLIPAIKDVIKNINLEKRSITIKVLEGLLD